MSATKLLLGLTDPCGHCGGAGELTRPTTYYGAEGLEQDWHYEPCTACNGTGLSDTAPAWMDAAALEHELITTQQEEHTWTY